MSLFYYHHRKYLLVCQQQSKHRYSRKTFCPKQLFAKRQLLVINVKNVAETKLLLFCILLLRSRIFLLTAPFF